MKLKLLLVPLFLTFFSCVKNKGPIRLDLKDFAWTLHDVSDSLRLRDVNPSDVHLALLQHHLIEPPFYRDNEEKLQWVGKKDWVFETAFDLPRSLLQHEKISLVFEGLDTYAEVFLNGEPILSADNMFRTWRVEVKQKLRKSNNRLKVVFRSPLTVNLEKQSALRYKLPEVRAFTRKAAYQFGWDWGPRFVTMGVWRPAYFEAWSDAGITDLFVKQSRISQKQALLAAEMTVRSTAAGQVEFRAFEGEKLLASASFELRQGENLLTLPFLIEKPELWWPNGMGDQHRYTFRFVLQKDGEAIDSRILKTGLRRVELVRKPDAYGESFYFSINGKPLFVKGANYIPQDNFLTRISDEKYCGLFETLIASHMNMLRVWGGGIYEQDLFYELCDQNGILVWQDFMFAGTLYPADSAFVENVRTEAVQNVRRLRNHPSLVLWCGNNEIDEAWHNWGWQKTFGYSAADSAKIWDNYLRLFEKVLPEVVAENHPGMAYVPTSPATGWGKDAAYRKGDVHYWGVWWGREPFSAYEEKVGRFMSEYGFQGMPPLKSIEAFTIPRDRNPESEVMAVHQKHPFGREAIRQYMERNFRVPDRFEDYVYVSQLLQAKGLKTAIEAHRRAKPRCMGTLYWQLNDCWPVTSWSTTDYYGRWKAAQYAVRQAYRLCLVSFEERAGGLDIFTVTDDTHDKQVKLRWYLLDFNGRKTRADSSLFFLPANSAKRVVYLESGMLPRGKSAKNTLLVAELWYGSKMLNRGLRYFAKPKDLALQKPEISMKTEKTKGGYLVRLRSDKLAKFVFLDPGTDDRFDENFFDLLPGDEKEVFLKTDDPSFSGKQIRIRSLYDTY
ncbi:MAG: glycoside hydrolase family 2 protein [Bacteroidales bacterium]|nr:glycoside hydrolase family 2 protein [Bacteroidales bacterium]